MSSLGAFRRMESAWKAYQDACNEPAAPVAKCKSAYREWLAANDIYLDYLRAERDDARAYEKEQG